VLALTLFAPGLIPAEAAHPHLAERTALYRWLCRAGRESIAAADADHALAHWFGLGNAEELPHAALSLLGAGIDPGTDWWLHADPVHLHAQRTELVLVDAARLEIDPAESAALIQSLDAHFAQDGISLLQVGAKQWYLRAGVPGRFRAVALSAAAGRNVDPLLPRGDDALLWNRRVNEAQMLLHGHPVNAAREARGAPAVNSVWLWGGGSLPPCRTEFEAVWSDSSLLRGMAMQAGVALHALPADAGGWLRDAGDGSHLVALPERGADGETGPALQDWFEPLVHALLARRLERLAIASFAHGRRVTWHLARSDRWKFWRRDPGLPRPSAHA